ncbi:MAG TPA: TolC family protein [Gemmatimonadaceae bacterium]|jgi:outer membrane protein TolC|nr:TolC family protein [Gemmatimonadaceae bacterium]
MMNHPHYPRLLTLGATIAILVALLAFFARSASAQSVSSDSTVRLTLGQAVRLAARDNVQVESARYRVEAASARVTQRRADLLPTLSANVAERGSTLNSAALFPIDFPSAPGQPPLFDPNGSILGPLNVFEARARVSQTVLDPSALGRVRGARTSVQAAGADLANVADQAAAGAANAYLMVLRADAVVTARLADSTLAAELLGIAQDQLRAGTGVALDVTRARSQLTGARTQLIVARNDRDRNHVELARALGLPLVRLELADSLASMPLSTTAAESAALGAAIRGRKDLQSIELQARAAREQAAAIRNERLPTIGVFADEGISQRNGRSYLPTYDWGIQLSLPIFDGLRREGRVEEQLSVARDLASRERDLRTQVEADVRIAVLNLTSSAEAVAAARERLGLAEQEVAQARERFQAGVAGNADVITASLTLNNARTQYVDALASYHAARVALARAQGSITTLE